MSSHIALVPPVDDDDLDALAREIAIEHEAVLESARSTVAHAVRCGDLLIEAKALVPRGEWLPWLADYFPASERTAQGYMRLARRANTQSVADLEQRGIAGALKLLAHALEDSDEPEPYDGPRIDAWRSGVDRQMRERGACEPVEEVVAVRYELPPRRRRERGPTVVVPCRVCGAPYDVQDEDDDEWAAGPLSEATILEFRPCRWARCVSCAWFGRLGEDDPDCSDCGGEGVIDRTIQPTTIVGD